MIGQPSAKASGRPNHSILQYILNPSLRKVNIPESFFSSNFFLKTLKIPASEEAGILYQNAWWQATLWPMDTSRRPGASRRHRSVA